MSTPKATQVEFGIGGGDGNPAVIFDFFLAERLGKTVDEVRAIPHSEWVGWQAYFKRKQQEEEQALRDAER